MSDKLVFDLASEVEGSPNVFIRKDWINILDNQNQNYNNNQSVLDTSQLSNSNKYMSYREAYLLIPMLLTLVNTSSSGQTATDVGFAPSLGGCDSCIGLKNWFGQIIHSFTLDYNGTTIIQQTPYINMWNSFKLMTSLCYDDLLTQGSSIGFYPDDAGSWVFTTPTVAPYPAEIGYQGGSATGQGVCNNFNAYNASQNPAGIALGTFTAYASGALNSGYVNRQKAIVYNPVNGNASYLQTANAATQLWKSYIFNQFSNPTPGVTAAGGVMQIAITATVYLKHIHAFFNMCPLLKGVFMKMTMNLNNSSTNFVAGWGSAASPASVPFLAATGVSNSVGGVLPMMITSASSYGVAVIPPDSAVLDSYQPEGPVQYVWYANGGVNLLPRLTPGNAQVPNASRSYTLNLSVGSRCLDSTIASFPNVREGPNAKSVYLYIPAYTFNPVFEQSYLSSPVKQIKYTDIYQYQVLNVPGGGSSTFNNLLTNGIANIKSVLIVPFLSSSSSAAAPITCIYNANKSVTNSGNSGFLNGISVFQSPFDTAGCGTTSPQIAFNNFNVQISGQNAIYNVQKYSFEEWNNQLYGQNAVNGGLTDGITSSLVDRFAFDNNACFYYVNVERMLPVEQSVPKSVQIQGINQSLLAVDLYCFIEYGVEISIDALTGARV